MHNDESLNLRLPIELMEKLDKLLAKLNALQEYRGHQLTRSALFRIAVERGLDVMAQELKSR